MSVERRDFLRTMAALVPVSIAACASFPPLRRSSGQAYSPRYFTPDELAFINAACMRLIPEDDNGPGVVELGGVEFIDREMEGAYGHAKTWYMQGPFATGLPELGYQLPFTPRELYRIGIADVNVYCRKNFGNKSFPELSAQTQDAVLTDMENGSLDLKNVSGKVFFDVLLQNTREGYLADPLHGGNKNMESWKMIGFPGARADFIDWIDKYGDRYPFGPVGVFFERGDCNG